jgi:hypothetical protein
MNDKLDHLLGKLKFLEEEMLVEVHAREKRFSYTIREGKVHFTESVSRAHHLLAKKIIRYWRDAKWSSFITTPVILSCIIPVAMMDFWATAYQCICFPAYGIPKVRRSDYIILDRQKLHYLNSMERLNCAYCGYVNGAITYVQEIAGRTEQHWCPVKHAVRLKTMHSRYRYFLDFGDAEQYRKCIEKVRSDFGDLKKKA